MRHLILCVTAAIAVLLGGQIADAQPCARQALRDTYWRQEQPAHPLVGKVFKGEQPIAIPAGDCARSPLQQLITEIWQAVDDGGIVLLGEVHDNPQHHLVRAEILTGRPGGAGRRTTSRPAAVFEHIRADQQSGVDHFYAMAARSRRPWRAFDLLRAVGWQDSGWPAGGIFEPLYDAALRGRMRVYPGDPPRARIKALAKGDRDGIAPAESALIALGERLPPSLVEALSQELVASHCGLMPASAFAGLNAAQRYRDAYMADVLVRGARTQGAAFLLAGNGHVRGDRGVPWYVRQIAPGRRVLSVLLIEVAEGRTDPLSYLPRDPEGRVAADYVLFTPAHVRPDPCERMRGRTRQGG